MKWVSTVKKKKAGKEWWWLKGKEKVTDCWDSGTVFWVFFFFLTDPPACAAVLVVTVGPNFDGSTVAGGIDLISQTAASWEGGVWGWESQKGRGCLFYRAVLCSAACNYPPLPHRKCKHQVIPFQRYWKKGRWTQELKNRGKVRNKWRRWTKRNNWVSCIHPILVNLQFSPCKKSRSITATWNVTKAKRRKRLENPYSSFCPVAFSLLHVRRAQASSFADDVAHTKYAAGQEVTRPTPHRPALAPLHRSNSSLVSYNQRTPSEQARKAPSGIVTYDAGTSWPSNERAGHLERISCYLHVFY